MLSVHVIYYFCYVFCKKYIIKSFSILKHSIALQNPAHYSQHGLTFGLDDNLGEDFHIFAIDTNPSDYSVLALGRTHLLNYYINMVLVKFKGDGDFIFGVQKYSGINLFLPDLNFYPTFLKITNVPKYCVVWKIGSQSEMILIDTNLLHII